MAVFILDFIFSGRKLGLSLTERRRSETWQHSGAKGLIQVVQPDEGGPHF